MSDFEYRIKLPKAEKKEEYDFDPELWYDYTTLLKTLEWNKDSTLETLDINIPRKNMKAIVLLCKKKNARDSEEYVNSKVKKVTVSVEGNPNCVY